MARSATLWSPDDMRVHKWNNPSIDAGRNFTSITGAFNSLIFYDNLDRIDFAERQKIILWYGSGYYLVILR
jgi:hypothetical protein